MKKNKLKCEKYNEDLSSIVDQKVNTNLCYNGKTSFVTWQKIVILKIKIKPICINAAANCNEHTKAQHQTTLSYHKNSLFNHLIMQCLHCLCSAYDQITLLICR